MADNGASASASFLNRWTLAIHYSFKQDMADVVERVHTISDTNDCKYLGDKDRMHNDHIVS